VEETQEWIGKTTTGTILTRRVNRVCWTWLKL